MFKTIGWKIALILAVIVFSLVMLYPPGEKINLGLDLKGGMHLVFRVETGEGIKKQTDNEVVRLKKELNELSIKYNSILRQGSSKIDIIGTTYEDENKIKELLDDLFRDWDYVVTSSGVTLSLRPNIEMQMEEQTVNQALETIRNRVDEFGVAEPVFQREGDDRLLIELPGVSDKEKMRVMGLIKSTAMLEFKKVMAGPFPSEEEALKQYNGVLPQDLSIIKWSAKAKVKDANVSVLESASVLTGRDLKIAKRSQDQWGGAAVAFSLNSSGASRFRTFTQPISDKNWRLSWTIELSPTRLSRMCCRSTVSLRGTFQWKKQMTWR